MNFPYIYIGTGGYTDADLIGTLYPYGTEKADFLSVYSQHYDTIELNSTFHAPIGYAALQGMVEKSQGKLRFSVKLHQDFSHKRTATAQQAKAFLAALQALQKADCLANLMVQFPPEFERTKANRWYVAELVSWFQGYPLAVEFRHPSWHIPTVFDSFQRHAHLIWCNVDYPPNIGLPAFQFQLNQRRAYWRLHGRNQQWWKLSSAQERHDYRYSEAELKSFAELLYHRRADFDELYLYFQNTTKSHSFYNIATLKDFLSQAGFRIKPTPTILLGQQSLF